MLNSRTEYNRCSIPRLTLEQTSNEQAENTLQKDYCEEDITVDWTEQMLLKRVQSDGENRKKLGRAEKSEVCKRKRGTGGGRRSKKRKYEMLDEDWGIDDREFKGITEVENTRNVYKMCGDVSELKWCASRALEWNTWRLRILAIEDRSGALAVQMKCADANGQVKCVQHVVKLEHRKETVRKKSWTKLKNGLYGWRVTRMTGRQADSVREHSFGDSLTSKSANGAPATKTKISNLKSNSKSGSTSNKRKYNDCSMGESKSEGEVNDPSWKTKKFNGTTEST